jgi:serine protease Do
VAQVEASYGSLNTTLNYAMTEIDNLEELVNSLTGTAPSRIYEEARNSVVVIRTNLGQGSGFFYAPDLILTNYHVIEGASSIEVEYYDRQRTQAFLVGGDPYADVAVIRVEMMRNISALTLANSSQALVGQQVIAIGNPLGLTGSLSLGYVAQVNKLTDIYPIIVPVLELDITIAPGSSRGPLLDLSGRVVGITNAGTGHGLNFAVPSNIVARAASSIQANGTYGHPYVGVQLVELTPDYINSNNINNIDPFQSGLMVTLVNPGTPAAEAGLQAAISGSEGVEARDIILAIDGHPILTFEDWAAYVEEQISPGETMLVELWRYGTTVTIPITPTRRPPYEE